MTQRCEKMGSCNTMNNWIDTRAITWITTKMHSIRWTIENVSKVELDTLLAGPDFQLSSAVVVGITLERTESNLYLINRTFPEIKIERKLYLCDCNGAKFHVEDDAQVFTLSKGISTNIISTVRSKIDNLPDDTLVINLSICMREEITTKTYHSQHVIDSQKKLIEDLKNMQENALNSDVSVQIGSETIPAHWSILCSRAPYFKKMFDSQMLERVKNSITITDLSLSTFKKLMEFLYTADFVEDDIEKLFELYYAADKYEVMDMRAICASRIMPKATADNVCRIFQLAHRHNDKHFKMQALDFMQFHSDAVFETEGWKKFEASEPLAAELFSFGMRKNNFIW